MNIEQARFNMIKQQIRPWEVLDENVLSLLNQVRREDFVPDAYRDLAFVDMEIPLREGGARGQAMLAPRVEARLLQEAAIPKDEKVLEVGAGSGYLTALIAHFAQRVISLEIEPELARMARANLQRAGIANADVRQIDAAVKPQVDTPFDVIVLGGSLHEAPQVLLSQVRIGGRLIGILGDEPMMRATVLTRTSETSWASVTPWDTVVPRLVNFPQPSTFRF